MAEDEIDQRLRDALLGEPADTDALDFAIRSKVAADARRIRRGKWIAAIGLAALLALMIGGYRMLSNRDAELCADAALDHKIEVAGGQARRWLNNSSAIAALAAEQRISLDTTKLAPAGYRLERGKLCRIGGRIFLHLVYADGAREFSLFLRQRPEQSNPSIAALDTASEHVAPVESSRYTALIVTDESPAAARRLAQSLSL